MTASCWPGAGEGSLKNSSAIVPCSLVIVPGRMACAFGQVNVDYNGRGDTVVLGRSYIALPHTRVDLAGALNQQIQVKLVSNDLSDFKPVAPDAVTLDKGRPATVSATVTEKSARRISWAVLVTNFSAEGRPFTHWPRDRGVENRSGVLATRAGAGRTATHFVGAVGSRTGNRRSSSRCARRHGGNADAGRAGARRAIRGAGHGMMTVDAHVAGTVGRSGRECGVNVVQRDGEGEKFDSLVGARLRMDAGSVQVPTLVWIGGLRVLRATLIVTRRGISRMAHGARTCEQQVSWRSFNRCEDRPGLRGVVTLNGTRQARERTFRKRCRAECNVRRAIWRWRASGSRLTATAGREPTDPVQREFGFRGSTIRVNGRSLLTGNTTRQRRH